MADHSIEVLVVEDSMDLADLIRLMLEEYRGAPFRGPVFRVSHVQRLAQARDRMGQGGIHAILLDLDLPDSRGLDTFARARASADDIPIIVLSELADGPLTAAAMRQGAQDYLVKGDMSIDLVARSIRYAIGRKEAERTLLREQAERIHAEASLRARDEFLALAAHELKTPLTALKGFVQLMARRGTYDRDVINRIVTQVNRLDRISRDLLQIARIETGQLELQPSEVDLVALVETTVLEVQATTRAHTLHVHHPGRPLVGRWDGDRLLQVLENLLCNAVKYSPDGGDIVVHVDDLGHEVKVAVGDAGLGIDTEHLMHVFDQFYRVSDTAPSTPGLGLGLYISKALVEAHGGRIWALSEGLGKGSTFCFVLPCSGVRNSTQPSP